MKSQLFTEIDHTYILVFDHKGQLMIFQGGDVDSVARFYATEFSNCIYFVAEVLPV